jgi:ribonuclease HII
MMKTNKNPSFKFEELYWQKGYKSIVGLDEVGRGSFAGPLVAAAVILPKGFEINGIKDSKLLNPQKREILSKYIIENALFYSISEVSVEYINKYGVGMATHRAFLNCLKKLDSRFDFVLVDGFMIKSFDKNMQKGIIHGDRFSVSIAAASIIAKVYRDNLMQELHKHFPKYGFNENKGYGTKQHRDALKSHGLCKIHRISFNLTKFTY